MVGLLSPLHYTYPSGSVVLDWDLLAEEFIMEAEELVFYLGANTQGKKAKRKAHERQLEEARQLTVLQKKRELKAAGIIMQHKTKKKGMEYNADIPFEKKPAPGFYNTLEEQACVSKQHLKKSASLREAERKKRLKRGKEGENSPHQTKFIAACDAQIQKLKEAESDGCQGKLVPPAAQVGETELEEIVKIGNADENARALVGGTDDPGQQLLRGCDNLKRAKMARTPRTTTTGQYPSGSPKFTKYDHWTDTPSRCCLKRTPAKCDVRMNAAKEEEQRVALIWRSQVVQRVLPRPPNVDLARLLNNLSLIPPPEGEQEAIQQPINLELIQSSSNGAVPGAVNVATNIKTPLLMVFLQPDLNQQKIVQQELPYILTHCHCSS
ncbi:hypothetical protein F5888DRAFT_1871873 [Russula emetica]|nr:hypothetical protein F5888DRAFT_1871873 [Russula emetica]